MKNAFLLALGEYGIKEIIGDKHHPRIIAYFEAVGHSWVNTDETAWCAAFVGWVLRISGLPYLKKLNARAYLSWGEETTKPKMGDLAIFWRGTPDSGQGHIGFFVRQEGRFVWILGGNQANEINIQKTSIDRLLGYRTYKVSNIGKFIQYITKK